MPKLIKRRRTKGWRMPEGAVRIGEDTEWTNPFAAGSLQTRAEKIAHFAQWVDGFYTAIGLEWRYRQWVINHLPDLRGRDLVCGDGGCADWDGVSEPAPDCHGVVLLRLANAAPQLRDGLPDFPGGEVVTQSEKTP